MEAFSANVGLNKYCLAAKKSNLDFLTSELLDVGSRTHARSVFQDTIFLLRASKATLRVFRSLHVTKVDYTRIP